MIEKAYNDKKDAIGYGTYVEALEVGETASFILTGQTISNCGICKNQQVKIIVSPYPNNRTNIKKQ